MLKINNTKDLFSVENKVIIVTGGARGIGLAYAIGFLNNGAKVAICDINEESIKEAENLLYDKYPDRVLVDKVNVIEASEIHTFTDKVYEIFGSVDVLVNNAGVVLRKYSEEMDGDDWDFVMDINVKGSFLFANEVGKRWISQGRGGKIINISSQTGVRACDRRLVYGTSKAAIMHFTRCLANEWGKYNIKVNAIAPGYIKTDLNVDARSNPTIYQKQKEEVPLGDYCEPEDLVGTMIYLSSAASDYITGVTVFADGGLVTR